MFCSTSIAEKHEFCEHIVQLHNDQVPEDTEPYEFAYSLYVNLPVGRKCVMCKTNNVKFNTSTLKYERLCSEECKTAYVKMTKGRMVNKYGQEHLLNDPDMQRKMINNHADSKDYVWDDTHKFRVIGTYEVDFLDKLKSLDWSPNDIIAPSPNTYHYKWKDGSEHMYIPDFYIPSLSLEVEIKQGTYDTNFMVHNREIEAEKDKMMKFQTQKTGINYIKILDKNYDEFLKTYINTQGVNTHGSE